MAFHRFTNNLTAGELTPLLLGRSDLQQYDRGAETLENVRVLPYGGVRIRSGLQYIAETKQGIASVARLVPFNFSTGTRFVLEFGVQYIRFYSNGVQVESSPGTPYEISSPYQGDALYQLQYRQINDVIYIVHPSYSPRKLVRNSDTSWAISEIEWTYPPLREENTTAITLTASGTTGSVTLTSSSALFVDDHVGGYFEIRHRREGEAVELDISGSSGTSNSTALTVRGDWQVITTERWYGTLDVERSRDGGSNWEVVRSFKSSADRNVSASGSESTEAQLRLTYTATGDPYGTAVWAGTAPTSFVYAKAKLESQEAFASGLVKITARTNDTTATATVVQTLYSTAATDIWSEGAWSPYRGWPRAVGIFEQRLFFGGNTERPTRFWGSKTGDFENFTYSEDDDGAVAFDIASTESNPIQWIESLQRILIGTAGDEVSASSGFQDEPLTPSNISVRRQSTYGSELYQPVLVNDVVVFLNRQARKIRELSFDIAREGYVAPELTLLAEHVTAPSVIQLGFSRMPDPLLLVVTGEHLAVMTYNREQGITAWARWETDGFIESACSVYGTSGDEIWCIVRRTVDGLQTRYVERFAVETEDKTTCKLLDSHISGTLPDPWDGTISGLDHLEARTVRLVVEGAVIGDYVVASGEITVDTDDVPTLGDYVVGLPYTATVKPMPMDIAMANGASQGRERRISELTVRFRNTLGCKFGPTLDRLDEVVFRDSTDATDSSPPLFTGDKRVVFPSNYDRKGELFIVQDQPLPFTVLGIVAKAEFFGG